MTRFPKTNIKAALSQGRAYSGCIAFIWIAFLAACAPAIKTEDAHIKIPSKFRQQNKTAQDFASEKYWELFADAHLNSLVETGLKNNNDLQAAAYRIQRDFSLAKVKFSEFFPQLSFNPTVERLRESLHSGQPVGQLDIPRDRTIYGSSLNFSYELDLWGAVRNRYKAAKAQAKNTYFTYLDTQLLLSAEIAKTYWNLRLTQLKLQALQEMSGAREEQYRLAEARQKAGLASEAERLRIGGLYLQVQNEWEAARLEQRRLLTSMAILLGEHPSLFETHLEALSLEPPTLSLPQLLPSEWIRRRPDIAAAEQNILAANAMTRAALADFFPKFTFNARFGLQSLKLSNLFSQGSQFFGFGPSVSLPLFDIGRNLANYRARKSEAWIALEMYKKTVLAAFKDVEDQLAFFNDAAAEFKNKRQTWQSSQRIAALEDSSYRAGLSGKAQLLERRIDEIKARLDAAGRELAYLHSCVEVMRSFGGGLSVQLFLR